MHRQPEIGKSQYEMSPAELALPRAGWVMAKMWVPIRPMPHGGFSIHIPVFARDMDNERDIEDEAIELLKTIFCKAPTMRLMDYEEAD